MMYQLIFFLITLTILPISGEAFPRRNSSNKQDDAQKMHEVVNDLRHSVSNHEMQLGVIEEQLDTINSQLEMLRKMLVEGEQEQEFTTQDVEDKLSQLDTQTKRFADEMSLYRTHAEKVNTILEKNQEKIQKVEEHAKRHNQILDTVQTTIKSLVNLHLPEETSQPSQEVNTYRVQAGDSLEKIARKHNTTIKNIKELNGLTSDRIRAGQLLKVPNS